MKVVIEISNTRHSHKTEKKFKSRTFFLTPCNTIKGKQFVKIVQQDALPKNTKKYQTTTIIQNI